MDDVAAGNAGYFFDDSEAYDGERSKPRKSEVESPNNLTLYRWRGPVLSPGEERDLIRAAQAGSKPAKERLLKAFHRLILKIAKEFYGSSRDDLIAAGALGLLEAIHRFDLRRNNGLAAYATSWIRKQIGMAVRSWHMAGDSSDTRADRLIYSTANITASEVAAKLGCSLEDAEAAVVRANARRAGHAHYSTTDAHYEDVPNRDDGETFIGPRPASSHEIYRMYDCFSRYKLAPHLRLHEATSRQIDDLDLATDKKAAARLKLKGARKYAQWLVNRERRIAEKHTALQDTNHWLYGQLWRDPNIAEERKLWLEQTEAARRKRKRKSAKLKLIRCEELDARADRPQDTRPFNERSKVA